MIDILLGLKFSILPSREVIETDNYTEVKIL